MPSSKSTLTKYFIPSDSIHSGKSPRKRELSPEIQHLNSKRWKSANDSESREVKTESPSLSHSETNVDLVESAGENTDSKVLWPKNSSVPYAALCNMFALVESTTKRLEILRYCSEFFANVFSRTPSDLLPCIYLTINRLAPSYQGVELGIGESLLLKAISDTTGRSIAQVKAEYGKTGDLGIIAQNSKMNQPTLFIPKALSVQAVFKNLKEIATASGHASQTKKVSIIKRLLSSCKGQEAKYLIRSLEGKLRINLAEKTVLSALAHAAASCAPTKTDAAKAEQMVKSVYNELPSYDIIVEHLVSHGLENLAQTCKLTPGIPLKPMLAVPTKAVSEILNRFEDKKFTCEYKYDGERAQVHLLPSGDAKIYSRNSEDMSNKYPDIIRNLPSFTNNSTTSFVLDCECVAWDMEQKCLLPFQVLSTRKRKDVKLEDVKVRVCLFAFDLLYLNGESLLQQPLQVRREKMFSSFVPVEGVFDFARFEDCTSIDQVQVFLDKSVQDKCEGLMVKMLQNQTSYYEPSRRSSNWLKLKKDYLQGIGDSLDLVVLGAFFGRGKRTSVYGAFLLGCFDPDQGEYQSICKIGTGFSETELEMHYKALSQHVTSRPQGYAHPTDGPNKPDVWFDVNSHKVVWEVLTADLSLSPVYKAAIGLVDENKGISLRFPRYIRTREDKEPEDATTSTQIAEMFRQQVARQKSSNNVDDDFEY